MTTLASKSARSIDRALGERLRAYRKAAGITQAQLAKTTGITFQQIQKYETGANRISFSRLVELAQALDCRVMDVVGDLIADADLNHRGPLPHGFDVEGGEELLAAFAGLPTPLRKMVLRMVATLADHGKGER